jgi:hypothetical protein
MYFQCDAKDMVCNIGFGWPGVRSTRRPIALELHPTPHSRHLDKGVAASGRPPSLSVHSFRHRTLEVLAQLVKYIAKLSNTIVDYCALPTALTPEDAAANSDLYFSHYKYKINPRQRG